MIDRNRLAETFRTLVSIDSVSRQEGRLAGELAKSLEEVGADAWFAQAWKIVGGDTGHLVAWREGTVTLPPLLLSAHMGTRLAA